MVLAEFPTETATLDDRTRQLLASLETDPDACEELVRLSRPMVEYLARRFAGRGEPLDDLVQVAHLGLLKAIDRFDLDRGVKFSTYATPTILGELKRHFRDKGWAIRVPRRLQEVGLQVRTVVAEVSQELGRPPTVQEVAERTDLSEELVLEAMDVIHAYSIDSIDAGSQEDGGAPADSLTTTDKSFDLLDSWVSIAPLLRTLSERERAVLHYRFVGGLTQVEIADQMHVSQMHVSRMLSGTLRTLRQGALEIELSA